MNRLLSFLVLLFLCSCNQASSNQNEVEEKFDIEKEFRLGGSPVKSKLSITSNEISLLDSITLQVTTLVPDPFVALPPLLTETSFEGWELLNRPNIERSYTNEGGVDYLILKSSYQLEPSYSGKLKIPKFVIPFRNNEEKPKDKKQKWKTYKIETEEFEISVSSVTLNPTEKVSGIRGFKRGRIEWLYLIISLTLILVGLGVFLYLGKRKIKEKVKDPYLEKQKAYQNTILRLEELSKQDFSQISIKELQTELSTILRFYLESVFDLKALEQTSEEFIQDIYQKNLFSGDQQRFLADFSNLTDLVKFASFEPDKQQNEEIFETIQKFVETSANSYFSNYDRS